MLVQCMELKYEQEKHVRKFIYSLLNSTWFWRRARLAINKKNRNISHCKTTNLLKTWFLFLVKQKKNESKFVNKSVEIIAPVILI